MIQVYTPRQLPCDGGASKLHGHPQSRHPDRDANGTEHEDRRDQERKAQQVELGAGADGERVHEPEENRADGPCEARDARVGPLQLALFRRTDTPSHEALQGGRNESDGGEDERGEQQDDVVRRQAPDDHRRRAEEQAREQRRALAEVLDESFHETPLHRDVQRAHEREGQADVEFPPSEPVERIQDEDGRQDLERHELDERHAGETEKRRMGAEEGEGPDRVRPAPRDALSVFRRKRLREYEETVTRAGEGERRGAPERNADAERAQHTSDGGTEDEADAPGGS